jgi:hypothetical protein
MSSWILVDTHYLCHRAFHTMGELSHDGEMTGVFFGALREVDLKMIFGYGRANV